MKPRKRASALFFLRDCKLMFKCKNFPRRDHEDTVFHIMGGRSWSKSDGGLPIKRLYIR
ncbi:hypothetical protein SAMN05518856_13414 [Paenibacillus sp. OK003]|nr:hypothetical protein SAMN05518856_13414 [Paenibacillus sp. OK003]